MSTNETTTETETATETETETETATETTIAGTTATDFLDLTLPDPGYAAGNDPSWPELIVEAFQALDATAEIRDLDEYRSDYTPKEDAKYLATDTGARYLGDGSSWNTIPVPGDGSVSEHGNAAHSETFVSDGNGTSRQVWIIANGASDPDGASADDLIYEEEA